MLHCRNLKLYIQLGMRLTKIHRVTKFKQQTWLKSYIELNIGKRKEAVRVRDKVDKLMCNAVFGKTMENVRKRVNIELLTSKKNAVKQNRQTQLQAGQKISR